ncbi:hypothetical protein GIB67_000377 [Kingdonia uniflora]|uniref:SUN domain-containing protein n=1 Tax=Kingdonia uniflora TaxID=39325 RepID=A0A7J7P7Q5_9MAGN|nr:hypothetical protein GIB67_000377 [Kingdonia uniflora]
MMEDRYIHTFTLPITKTLPIVVSQSPLMNKNGIGQCEQYLQVDGSEIPVNQSNWQEFELGLNNGSDSGIDYKSTEFDTKNPKLSACAQETEATHNDKDSPISEENYNYLSRIKEQPEVETSGFGGKFETNTPKSERLSRTVPPGLDEFKSRASSPKEKPFKGHSGTIIHRLETGGSEYNYASASKGAKILDFNKEAKGASNILGKDKDNKFEHYSSNLQDFELLGSLVYPTEKWVNLGVFKAGNVKHAQRLTLQEPKWVRYLKLNLLSHYGFEFYCTLSSVEIYGVDAVERMLEDLISVQDSSFGSKESITEQISSALQTDPVVGEDIYESDATDIDAEFGLENSNVKHEIFKSNAPTSVSETRPQQGGRMPGDAVLKILMQKVRSLDLSLAVLERYLEELNSRYGNIFKELDEEIAAKDELLLKLRNDMKNLAESKEAIAKDVAGFIDWKYLISLQVDSLVKDNAVLRLEVERVRKNQVHMENKGSVIFFLSLIFGLISIVKLFIDMITMSLCRIQKSGKFSGMKSSWLLLLLTCSIVVIVLL